TDVGVALRQPGEGALDVRAEEGAVAGNLAAQRRLQRLLLVVGHAARRQGLLRDHIEVAVAVAEDERLDLLRGHGCFSSIWLNSGDAAVRGRRRGAGACP